MASKDPLLTARSQVAYYSRTDINTPNRPAKEHEARLALSEARVERAITRALADAPPLTAAQRDRLAQLLAGGAR